MTGIQIVRDTLARHRDQPSISLELTLPINWQMDDRLSKVLKKDLEVHGAWDMWRATPSLGDHIPAKTGLYMFVFRSHLALELANKPSHSPTFILYVGRAGDANSSRTLKDRYKGEYAKYVTGDPEQLWDADAPVGRAASLKKYLSMYPIEYWCLVVNDRGKIPHLEDRLIKLFSPPLNSHGRLRLKIGEPKPAFKVPK